VIPTARNAHSIITDNTNRFVFVPHLGTAHGAVKAGSGPRHIIMSTDNRFAYLLNELTATATTLSLDAQTGLLTEGSSASALPADTKLVPGAPRPSPGRNVDNDIWSSDLHHTPDGKFLYAAERTSSSLGAFSVDPTTGKLTYLSSTPTETQPRGFAIDPTGRTMVVGGEKSEPLSVYAIDPPSGALSLRQKYPAGKGSNWVEIASFE
jgi:6-phosphogluconolactonase